MNTVTDCREVLQHTNKDQIQNLGRYLDKVKYK